MTTHHQSPWRLQEYSDQQTHQLPVDESGQLRLAASMGSDDVASFNRALENFRNKVHQHFQMLLESGDAGEQAPQSEAPLDSLWQAVRDNRQAGQLSFVGLCSFYDYDYFTRNLLRNEFVEDAMLFSVLRVRQP